MQIIPWICQSTNKTTAMKMIIKRISKEKNTADIFSSTVFFYLLKLKLLFPRFNKFSAKLFARFIFLRLIKSGVIPIYRFRTEFYCTNALGTGVSVFKPKFCTLRLLFPLVLIYQTPLRKIAGSVLPSPSKSENPWWITTGACGWITAVAVRVKSPPLSPMMRRGVVQN